MVGLPLALERYRTWIKFPAAKWRSYLQVDSSFQAAGPWDPV
jgi:hypothetical protein